MANVSAQSLAILSQIDVIEQRPPFTDLNLPGLQLNVVLCLKLELGMAVLGRIAFA